MELVTVGAEAKKPAAAKPKTPAEAVAKRKAARKSLILDIAKSAKACQKAGINLADPATRAALVAAGGSAMALAARVGPKKTLACINHFTALAQKHKGYINYLERSYGEMRCFARQLEAALGKMPVKKAKAKADVSAEIGAWGTLLAMGALGAAGFFVIRAFTRKAAASTSPREKLEAEVEAWTDVQLKDAALKKHIPAKMKTQRDEKTGKPMLVYTGEYKGKTFKVICAPGSVPVYSGLQWKCMPKEMAAKITIEKAEAVAGLGAYQLYGKDAIGVESCGVDAMMGRRRKQRIPGQVPAGTIPPVRAPRTGRIPPGGPRAMRLRPGPVSPLNERIGPGTSLDLSTTHAMMPMNRRYTGAVTTRQNPTIWPGSRGSYDY